MKYHVTSTELLAVMTHFEEDSRTNTDPITEREEEYFRGLRMGRAQVLDRLKGLLGVPGYPYPDAAREDRATQ